MQSQEMICGGRYLSCDDTMRVFAAGNANVNNDVNPSGSYPSVYTSPSVLSVAASTSTDAKAGFSNYGPVSVDLAAPGQSILSTWNSRTRNKDTKNIIKPNIYIF